MANELSGGYEPTSNYIPRTAEDSDGTSKVTTRRGVTLRNAFLATAGGLVLAATLTACGPNSEPVPTPTETSEAPTPTPTETTQTPEQIIDSLEIPTGLDKDTLAEALFEDRFTQWLNYGADDATISAWLNYNGTVEEFVPTVTGPNGELFAEALYIPEYKNDSVLAHFAESNVKSNTNVLTAYIVTMSEAQPYSQSIEVASVEETNVTDTERTLIINTIDHNNSAQNTVIDTVAVEGHTSTWTVTLRNVDGQEKISFIAVS